MHPVPNALREKTEQELQGLEELGVIVPVESSEWPAPVVPVVKMDRSVHICGDFCLTVNKVAANKEASPLSKIEDLFASLEGGQEFTKLDVAHAHLHIPLVEAPQKYVTINTHWGCSSIPDCHLVFLQHPPSFNA